MKKKYLFCGLAFCFCLGLGACTKEKSTNENQNVTVAPSATIEPTLTPTDIPDENLAVPMTKDELLALSGEYILQMVSGDYSNIVKQFSEAVKKQLSEKDLKSTWEQTIAELGSYIGIYEKQSGEANGNIMSGIILQYEKGGVAVQFAYGATNEIEGLYFSNYNIPEPASDALTEIPIEVGSEEYPLDGMLTIPNGVENPPVVILVQGSGQSDMNETVGAAGNRPFRDIAFGLAERGIASVRYNKRFFQYPETAEADMTIEDEVLNDVSAAIELMKQEEKVDGSRIYILGHSLGGMLAPKIAMDHPEISGIISLAGSPRGLEDIILDQNRAVLDSEKTLTQDEKAALLLPVEQMVEKVKSLSDDELEEAILGATGYYWRSLNEIKTPEIVKELTLPMLILQGSEDFQVYADVDYLQWQELLSDRENVEFHLYQGLNHLFLQSNGAKDTTEYNLVGHVEKQVLEDISVWIKKQTE